MKFLKKENIICFILLFIEIILLALSVGIEFYHLYSKSMDISYAVGTTSALASVFGAFAWNRALRWLNAKTSCREPPRANVSRLPEY